MKKGTFLLLALFVFVCVQVGFAQNKQITGTVISADDGSPIPGVTIIVKGMAGVGTITDLDGNFTLDVPETATKVVVSFVGMQTKDVDISSTTKLSIKLASEDRLTEEVVVTAIGVKREQKSLGYSATQVSNESLTQGRDKSALNALQGKVAGVNITNASGAPGASTRVILRGFTSISGSNQPLYVVDGVPINNSSSSDNSLNGGTDFGNAANDLNPDDIESMTVLKGASSTALYGSRAANGVIVITTKKGKSTNKNKGLEIEYSGTATFYTPLRLPQLQNVFGQGIRGERDIRENTSFGPKFDDELRYWGYTVDGARLIKPYSGLANNVRDFFDVGSEFTNALSFTGGDEKTNYFFSFSNVKSDGIMPYDKDTYNRNTISLRGSTKLSNNFTSSGSLNYVKKTATYVPTGQGGQSVYNNVLQIPRDIPILELRDYNNKFFSKDNFYGNYTTNPYFTLFENGNKYNSDRVYGNGELKYTFNEYLNATFRAGTDVSNSQLSEWRAIKTNTAASVGGHNEGTDDEPGQMRESTSYLREFNTDFLLSYNRTFGDFEFGALVGHNFNERSSKDNSMEVLKLNIPGFYQISNSPSTPSVWEYKTKRRLVGVYGSFDIGYKKFLYSTITFRNDWSSTLPTIASSERKWWNPYNTKPFFYPSINLSFVISDAFPSIQKILPFGKIRAGLAQTGNDAGMYLVRSVFVQGSHSDGFTSLKYPLFGNINSYEVSNRIGNPDLSPEITTEYEIGTELRFLNNRLAIDFTYYNKTIRELIYDVPLPNSSGYSVQTRNIGEINNKGLEFLVTITPVKKGDLNWDISFNFSNNRNKIVKLTEGLDQVPLGGLAGLSFVGRPGYPMGLFEGPEAERVEEGEFKGCVIVDNTGLPIPSTNPVIYGNSQYDYILGITNQFRYKRLSLGFTFDIRKGGLMYSRTVGMTYFTGISPVTLFNDRQPFIIPNSVQEIKVQEAVKDANGNPVLVEQNGVNVPVYQEVTKYVENKMPVLSDVLGGGANTYWDLGGTEVGRHQVIDKSFVKLRELSLAFSFPKPWVEKVHLGSASISIVGRNLLLWTPEENRFIDPEMTTFGNDLEADYGEFGATPSVRSVGCSIKFTF